MIIALQDLNLSAAERAVPNGPGLLTALVKDGDLTILQAHPNFAKVDEASPSDCEALTAFLDPALWFGCRGSLGGLLDLWQNNRKPSGTLIRAKFEILDAVRSFIFPLVTAQEIEAFPWLV